MPTQDEVDATCAAHPVPRGIAPLFDGLGFGEFVATATIRLWLDLYNTGDGVGIFEGMGRYDRLESRLRDAAVRASTLRVLWDRLCHGLQAPIHGGEADRAVLSIVSVPAAVQQATLRAITDDYRTIVALARAWHTEVKCQSAGYAERAGIEQAEAGAEPLSFDAGSIAPGSAAAQVVQVPTISGNTLRHQLVREPAWLHLCAALGLDPGAPGKGPVPFGVEALFLNGGNLKAGAKEPENVGELAAGIRERFPALDLLGGNLDAFDLGESRLQPSAWLVCRENRHAIVGSIAEALPEADVSVFDLLDDVTLTRQATPHGLGQMIWSFETLCPGSVLYVRLRLAPWTPVLSCGALWCAIETARFQGEPVGGQSARGFGSMRYEYVQSTEEWERDGREYENYLEAHRETLRAALVEGTMGAGRVLLAA